MTAGRSGEEKKVVSREDWEEPRTVEEARELLLDAVHPIEETEGRKLLEAVGYVLGEDQLSGIDQPPFRRSPLDGYALLSSDTRGASRENPAVLRVIDRITAGQVCRKTVTPGCAVRIMTGAPIPEGADCVVRQEDTDFDGPLSARAPEEGGIGKMDEPGGEEPSVRVFCELAHNKNIVPAGEDFRRGTLLAKKGEIVTADTAGILAAAGITQVPVVRRPRVAVITTGDELMPPGQALLPGKIFNSNQMVIAARLLEWKADLPMLCPVADDPDLAAEKVREACRTCDLVITTGGVSVGEKDIMHDVWKKLHARRLFWRVRVKPGMPTLAFLYEDTPVLALSGNPYAALVHLELLAAPVLAKLAGDARILPKERTVCAADDWKAGGAVRRIVRAYAEGGQAALPKEKQRNGRLRSDTCTNCYADIPEGEGLIARGTKLTVWIPSRI